MSRVFVAHERTLGRDVVVKVLPPEMAGEVSLERFEREIQLAARLQHPHIVPVLSAGAAGGSPYFVMPYIAGESLRERMQRGGELPVGEAIRLLRDVATALEYAHSHGIVHRDIKPENILITGGTAVVTDFGVAKALAAATGGGAATTTLTTIGTALGTPAYMAPEQAAADPTTDHRADIYAWGVVAYEVLTGSPPFVGRPPQALFAAHIAEPPPPITERRAALPIRLADLVMHTLAKRPADRPQTAHELVRELDEIAGSTATLATTAHARSRVRGHSKALMVALAVGAAVIVAAVAIALSRRSSAPTSAATVKSIAVLPFLTGGGGDEYFAEGMSDELSAALGRVPGLQVASRTSTFAFKGPSVDIREVGKRLRVDAVLEGSVRRAANRLRVTAQLSNASTGLSLWSDSYEREVRDVFAVQDNIARAIASALQVRFASGADGTDPLAMRGTRDLQAYDAYLRGRYYWHRRGAENLGTSLTYFERAIARDPNFARAHAGLAIAAVLLPEYSDFVDSRELHARAEVAVNRALSLDSTIAEAYAARGLARIHVWDWAGAEESYRRALHFEPRYATAHQWYGELLYHLGRPDESVAAMRRSAELDPLAPIAAVALGYSLLTARKYQESLREAERAVELAPNLGIAYRNRAFSSLFAGDPERGYRDMVHATQLEPELSLRVGQVVFMAAKAGKRAAADSVFRELKRLMRKRPRPFAEMWAYLGFGDYGRAVEALEQAIAEHEPLVSGYSLLSDPSFDPLRSDPGFRRALDRMGLLRNVP